MPDLSYCAHHVYRLDRDRFLCALFAPALEREALCALYAFNIEIARIREVVREPMLGQIRLQWWRDVIDDIYAQRTRQDPIPAALAEAVARYDLSRDHFTSLMSGRAFDFEDRPPSSLEDLVAYASSTSTPLIRLAAEVCGARDARSAGAAQHLGVAWALIGLIRAVPFHAQAQRLYLPAELMRTFDVDVFKMFQAGYVTGLDAVVAAVVDRAQTHLSKARALRTQVPSAALPAFLPATLARGYLKRIVAAQYNPFHPRVQASSGPALLLPLLLSRVSRRY